MASRIFSGWPLILIALLVVSSGCSTTAKKRRAERKAARAAAEAAKRAGGPGSYPGVDVTEASIRGEMFVETGGLVTIYFDYDSSNLKTRALSGLKNNAEYLKENRDLEVLVAGHCDERGTIEYNLALGQKRAKEVREYYIRLGVPGKSIATISYGEEKSVCDVSTEECWAMDRRAETRVRTRTASKYK